MSSSDFMLLSTMIDQVDVMLSCMRGSVVAAAGCGKTELLARMVADVRSGRQLVLTHTHAGIAALKRRFERLRIPSSKYSVMTIDGWALKLAGAYPSLSELSVVDAEGIPDWAEVAPGAIRVVESALGEAILHASFDGILVDEYQDCTAHRHRFVCSMAEVLPCRIVGDPLQAVFGFRADDPLVPYKDVEAAFERKAEMLEPWRWRREGCNRDLGEWLTIARAELLRSGQVTIPADGPVKCIEGSDHSSIAAVCRTLRRDKGETAALIAKWPRTCVALAQRLGGYWPVVERFDDPTLLELAELLSAGNGRSSVRALFDFVADRVTKVRTALRTIAYAIADDRPTTRFRTHLDHRDRLVRLASLPSPETLSAALEGMLTPRDWVLYRPENIQQLRAGLRECHGQSLDHVPDAVAAARVRARHRGRRTYARTIGTPLLLKGLEFDHTIVVQPESLGLEGLYVALTRGSKTLTIVGRSRVIKPRTTNA